MFFNADRQKAHHRSFCSEVRLDGTTFFVDEPRRVISLRASRNSCCKIHAHGFFVVAKSCSSTGVHSSLRSIFHRCFSLPYRAAASFGHCSQRRSAKIFVSCSVMLLVRERCACYCCGPCDRSKPTLRDHASGEHGFVGT